MRQAQAYIIRVHISGKCLREEDVSSSLLPEQLKNRELSTIEVFVDGQKCVALVNSGCLQTLVSNVVCSFWRQ